MYRAYCVQWHTSDVMTCRLHLNEPAFFIAVALDPTLDILCSHGISPDKLRRYEPIRTLNSTIKPGTRAAHLLNVNENERAC